MATPNEAKKLIGDLSDSDWEKLSGAMALAFKDFFRDAKPEDIRAMFGPNPIVERELDEH